MVRVPRRCFYRIEFFDGVPLHLIPVSGIRLLIPAASWLRRLGKRVTVVRLNSVAAEDLGISNIVDGEEYTPPRVPFKPRDHLCYCEGDECWCVGAADSVVVASARRASLSAGLATPVCWLASMLSRLQRRLSKR